MRTKSHIEVNMELAKLLGIDTSKRNVIGFTLVTRFNNYPLVVVRQIIKDADELTTQVSRFTLTPVEGGAQ